MNRCVWIILNENFEMMLDAEILNEKIVDKKFSPGSDIWTNELPELRIRDEKVQKEYDEFRGNILTFFLEPQADKILIDAKIGEESEYLEKIIIRKIEEYDVEEIID
ncbi:MAG: hypothetical protein IJQ68_06495 [Methanobrevibacter sp.]|uniref:hypothetical protein n=1 Tax=Methanobrevibacter sp. TaxID=66852 RepID=UPI0025DC9BA7|nr:hypothetical protein [Methanobrevibacter sp.]MBR0271620.1 hypothetical protein [Methanobrevibacter sp.]